MRHLSTLIAAMFVAPFSWLLLAAGQDRSAQAFADVRAGRALDTGDLVPAAICLAGAGLLLGLLASLRFSPLGAVLTGAGYAAGYLAMLFEPDGVLGLFPRTLSVAGHSVDPATPLRTGTALLLGALLLISAGRPRRRPAATAAGPRVTPVRTRGPEPARRRPLEVARPGPSEPVPATEPEHVARHASTPRSGNTFPKSYASGNNTTDRWAGGKRSAWPYAQRPQDRSLDG